MVPRIRRGKGAAAPAFLNRVSHPRIAIEFDLRDGLGNVPFPRGSRGVLAEQFCPYILGFLIGDEFFPDQKAQQRAVVLGFGHPGNANRECANQG